MTNIIDNLFKYLRKHIDGFEKKTKCGKFLFTCPQHSKHKFKSASPTATFLPNSNKITCLICGFKGTPYDCVRVIEEEKKHWTDAEITNYLIESLDLDEYSELEYYKKYEWELIPIITNDKVPLPGEKWKDQHYKDKVQWIKWLNNNLNIGCKTGEINNITVIDFDSRKPSNKVEEEIYNELIKLNTLMQNTPHGKHFIISYDKDLQQGVKLGGTNFDIRNDGGYIIIAPSKINNDIYEISNIESEIKKIPDDLKKNLLELRNRKSDIQKTEVSSSDQHIKLKNNNLDGCCNDSFIKLGGVLTKIGIQKEKRNTILHWLNKNWLENPMNNKDINGMLHSLGKYEVNTEENHENAIYAFMESMQTDITPNDVLKGVFNNDSSKSALVYKYLSKLVKDGKAIRLDRGRYQFKHSIQWDDSIPSPLINYKYKVPFFSPYESFVDGDLLLLGLPSNHGKSTISLNIIKQIINQGIKPYYFISGEASSRWQKISDDLNITGKFFRGDDSDPTKIELEYNAFTILDWLHFKDKSKVDTIISYLSSELQRKKGILIVFTQVRKSYEWFAPDLIDHFPTFAARYIHDDEEKIHGHWVIDKAKDLKGNGIIQCEYNHKTKIFKPKDLI